MARRGIGLTGCGAMGSALVRGMVLRGGIVPDSIFVYDLDAGRRNVLARELGVVATAGLDELVHRCRYLFIAVKPEDVKALLNDLKPFVLPEQSIVSIAAGITLQMLENGLPSGTKVIRLMPNTPCLAGEGTIALCSTGTVSPEETAEVITLLQPLGLTVSVPEKLMDAVTALSGSGPAYVYLFAETLIDAGVAAGLPHDIAVKLALQTMLGSVKMLQENPGLHPAEMRNRVTSPAGTTSAALQVLEEAGFRGAVIKAVLAATRRSEELQNGGRIAPDTGGGHHG